MGADKGLMSFRGKAMIEHIIEELQRYTKEIIIISNNEEYKKFALPVHKDIISNKGPLGGIYTGLIHSNNELNLVVSCDVPFVNDTVLSKLIEHCIDYDITVFEQEKQLHPLIGVYRKTLAEDIKKAIDNGQLKAKDFIRSASSNIINVDAKTFESVHSFRNINTLQELNQYE